MAQTEKGNRENEQEIVLNQLMDTWHLAAAKANEKVFFSMMSEDAVYIGTDKTERWLRDELREWSAEAFARESAWNFKAKERNWRINKENQFAICDELLETWMGPCRSTAVLGWNGKSWQIIHYQLSVTVDNAKIEDFKSLQEQP
jgi:hypothetical protein